MTREEEGEQNNSGDKFICPEKDEERQNNSGTWIIYPEKDAPHAEKAA